MDADECDDDYDYDFDPEKAVAAFREVILHRDEATGPDAREEFETIALRMREAWRKWQGEDSLYEMAFGEWLGEE